MPYEIFWEPRGVFVSCAGMLLPAEMLECHEQITRDRRFDSLRHLICDTLRVSAASIGKADVEHINAFLKGPAMTNPHIQVVFVASHPDVLRALSLYEAVPDRSYEVVVCSSMKAARAAIAAGRS